MLVTLLVKSTACPTAGQYTQNRRSMRFPKPPFTSMRALIRAVVLTLFLPLAASPAAAQPSSAAAQPQSHPQSDSHLAEAQSLFKAGEYPQALIRADAHIARKPKDPQGRFMKGLILAEMKKTADAIAVFKKLTEDYPELPEPYNNLAVLYAQEKQFEGARRALEAAIKTHPSYAVAHENLGDVYSKLASQAYGKALQIDSSNPSAQSKLALIRDLICVTATQSPRPADAARPPVKPLAALTPPPSVATPPQAPTAAPAAVPSPALITAPPVTAPAPPPAKATPAPVVTPTPAKASPPAQASSATSSPDEAAQAVRAWAAAWSKKDVRGYLAAYAPEFVPPGGLSRKAWEAERAARLTKPGAIEVGVEKIEVTLPGSDRATVRFRQNYKSANLKTSAGKTLHLVRLNGRWMIKEERVN